MAVYRHRQWGRLLLWALGLAVALILILMAIAGFHPVALVVLVILIACQCLFYALTVEVTRDEVTVSLGSGLIRRRIPIARIREVRAVRNRWYYGWGIRLIPRGWMYNVSGLHAVELHLADGSRFRIGTDDPEGVALPRRRATSCRRGMLPRTCVYAASSLALHWARRHVYNAWPRHVASNVRHGRTGVGTAWRYRRDSMSWPQRAGNAEHDRRDSMSRLQRVGATVGAACCRERCRRVESRAKRDNSSRAALAATSRRGSQHGQRIFRTHPAAPVEHSRRALLHHRCDP